MAYVTAEEVKAFAKLSWEDLGYSSEDEFDAFLNELIGHAESIIENYCKVPRDFFKPGGTSFTDQLYDFAFSLHLRYKPVLTVSNVKINLAGYGQTPNWHTLSAEDYVVDKEAGIIHFVGGKAPATQLQSVKVSYTAGYSETPYIIKYAVLQLCSNLLHAILQRKISPIIRIDDWSVKVVLPEAFSAELQHMLEPYVRRVVSVG